MSIVDNFLTSQQYLRNAEFGLLYSSKPAEELPRSSVLNIDNFLLSQTFKNVHSMIVLQSFVYIPAFLN